MGSAIYSGIEAGKTIAGPYFRSLDCYFSIAIAPIPDGAAPIVDEISGDCVGFMYEGAKNVWHILDVTGQYVGIEESPLETPLVDPYDLILVGPAVLKVIRAGIGAVAGLMVRGAAISAIPKIANGLMPILRSRLLHIKSLRFTSTTAAHMANPGRFVPVHILHLAIKYGKRMPDPQKVTGVFRYEIQMTRFVKRSTPEKGGKQIVNYVKELKDLEVVVRESDWTILHFLYK